MDEQQEYWLQQLCEQQKQLHQEHTQAGAGQSQSASSSSSTRLYRASAMDEQPEYWHQLLREQQKHTQAGAGQSQSASSSSSSTRWHQQQPQQEQTQAAGKLRPEYWPQFFEKIRLNHSRYWWLEDTDVAKNCFDTTVGMITKAWNSVTKTRKDVAELFNCETSMFILFQFAHTLLSFGHIFSCIKFYETIKAYVNWEVLNSEKFPDAELKNKIFVQIQSYVKVLETSNCRRTNLLVQIFNDILNLDREEFLRVKTKEKEIVPYAPPEEEGSSSKKRDSDHPESSSLSKKKKVDDSQMVDAACGMTTSVTDDQPQVLDSAKELEILSDAEVKLVLEHMKMSKNEIFRGCVVKSLNKLEKNANDYIANVLFGIEQMLSKISELVHLPKLEQAAGDNPPSSKFKWILLILKEMMTQIRESSYPQEFGFNIPEYLETKTAKDVKIFGISYESTESFPKNLENCNDVELLFWLELSKSMQSMVRLQNLMKEEFLSFQRVVEGRVNLDVESFDLLRYLVDCVKQMKNDLKEKVKQLSLDVQQPRVLFEGPNVCQKMQLFHVEIVKDLAADLESCRQSCHLCDKKMFQAFHMLMFELELSDEFYM